MAPNTIDRTGDASIDAFNNYTDQNMVNDPVHADDVTNMASNINLLS
jgi:hypothetical protein